MRLIKLIALLLCLELCGCASFNKAKSTEPPQTEQPKLLKPKVKKIFIPPEIRSGGREWVEGHYMFRIEQETTWSR